MRQSEWSARTQKSRGTRKRKERQGEKGEGGEQERERWRMEKQPWSEEQKRRE